VIVKICGITRAEDASMAVSLGATAIGFVFWPDSPRRVSPADAAAIVATLPAAIWRVGVFVDAPREEIERVAAEVGLSAVQLHGRETPAFASALHTRVIKALALADLATDDALAEWNGMPILLDAHDPIRKGGTGRTIDWDRAAVVASRHEVILAGGLRPGNVAAAIARVRPHGIDVSSGVERAPGVKDHEKLRALFEVLRGVEA
jgi:phosphoribosylanthranilate isomerase